MLKHVVFDLGGVLLDHNPRYLYQTIFSDELELQHFLENICTHAWNERQDAGRLIADANQELIALHPEKAELIEAYYARWEEMLKGSISDTVEILDALRSRGAFRLFALSNFSAETFPIAQRRLEFLSWFEGIVVSGEEGLIKPDPAIFELFLNRYDLCAEECVFIDDRADNVATARKLGFTALHFTSAEKLEQALRKLQIL